MAIKSKDEIMDDVKAVTNIMADIMTVEDMLLEVRPELSGGQWCLKRARDHLIEAVALLKMAVDEDEL